MFPSITPTTSHKNQNKSFLQRITENNLTPETSRSMYNALKVKWMYWAHQFQRVLKPKMKFIKCFFFLFPSVTLYTFVSIDRSNIFYLLTCL